MNIVYEYVLNAGTNVLNIPRQTSGDEAEILKVGFQYGKPSLWAKTSTVRRPSQERTFVVIPTGMEFDDRNFTFVDTCVSDELVLHIFEAR